MNKHFTEEEIQRARDKSLVEYIRYNEGWTVQRVGNFYTTKEHDSLRICNDEKTFFWNSKGINGHNVIDWVQKTQNLSFVESVALILGENLSISAPITTVSEPKNPPKIMQLPVASENNSKAYTYLHEVRKIDSVILEHVFKSGLAYQDVFDNVVFIGYDENGTAKFAETRTTLGNSSIKPKNITGSDKKYSFHLDCSESDTLYVFEAPIDLLSHCTLYLWKYGLWDNVNRLRTCLHKLESA